MAVTSKPLDPVLAHQVAQARERQASGLRGREGRARLLMLGVFLAGALPLALLADSARHPAWWLYPAFVVGYALFSTVGVEVGPGLALPTELAFVPMLFVLPAAHVPLVVAGGMVVAVLPRVLRGTLPPARAFTWPANALFAIGPSVVVAAAGEPAAGGRAGAVVVAAIAAQFACDLAASSAHEWLALRVPPRDLLGPLAWTFGIDALMAPVGYGIAVAARVETAALLLPVPLVALLSLLARERRERLDSLLELSSAYRGTALLLGDVVEADDAYTADHSRQVVDLVLAVCDRLGIGGRERHLAEFTALLHDVGKIRVPSEIIRKPGRLTPEERAIVETHTIEGERLLLRVGGLLGEVGRLVRATHERYDGGGYPDGLAGDEIPLVARIVCCCDAFNAMTTDRPYRSALSPREAADELTANRGTQFDPPVVDALLAVVAA